MVELARLQHKEPLVRLKQLARITGLSEKYLGQLAILLKRQKLLIGVSGRKGGYKLGRPAGEITFREILYALHGPISATRCVANPHICLNAEFCEARTIWAVLSDTVQQILDRYTLADLIDRGWMTRVRQEYGSNPYLRIEEITGFGRGRNSVGCPGE